MQVISIYKIKIIKNFDEFNFPSGSKKIKIKDQFDNFISTEEFINNIHKECTYYLWFFEFDGKEVWRKIYRTANNKERDAVEKNNSIYKDSLIYCGKYSPELQQTLEIS